MKIKRDKYDKIMSEAVREANDWTCEKCGKQSIGHVYGFMDNAHNFSRRYATTKLDPRNTALLCRACHFELTENPHDHVKFFKQLKGEDYYIMEQMRHVKNMLKKHDKDEIYKHYLRELDRIKDLRFNGYQGKIELEIPEALL